MPFDVTKRVGNSNTISKTTLCTNHTVLHNTGRSAPFASVLIPRSGSGGVHMTRLPHPPQYLSDKAIEMGRSCKKASGVRPQLPTHLCSSKFLYPIGAKLIQVSLVGCRCHFKLAYCSAQTSSIATPYCVEVKATIAVRETTPRAVLLCYPMNKLIVQDFCISDHAVARNTIC
jgi:hypothetical protein